MPLTPTQALALSKKSARQVESFCEQIDVFLVEHYNGEPLELTPSVTSLSEKELKEIRRIYVDRGWTVAVNFDKDTCSAFLEMSDSDPRVVSEADMF